jgi:hypothetical protein
MENMKFKTLKEKYTEMMANKICVSLEDLSDNEKNLIEAGYEIFKEKLEDIKIIEDENKRISIELANLKSYVDDSNNDRWNRSDTDDDDDDSDY